MPDGIEWVPDCGSCNTETTGCKGSANTMWSGQYVAIMWWILERIWLRIADDNCSDIWTVRNYEYRLTSKILNTTTRCCEMAVELTVANVGKLGGWNNRTKHCENLYIVFCQKNRHVFVCTDQIKCLIFFTTNGFSTLIDLTHELDNISWCYCIVVSITDYCYFAAFSLQGSAAPHCTAAQCIATFVFNCVVEITLLTYLCIFPIFHTQPSRQFWAF